MRSFERKVNVFAFLGPRYKKHHDRWMQMNVKKIQSDQKPPTSSTPEERLRARAEAIENFRARAGYSMDDLAKAMGFSGQSSIQRYLSPDYDKRFRPELIERFEKALLGKGKPPIMDYELTVLWVGQFDDAGASPATQRAHIDTAEPTLDLPEGRATLKVPANLSVKSATLLRLWVESVIESIESTAKTGP